MRAVSAWPGGSYGHVQERREASAPDLPESVVMCPRLGPCKRGDFIDALRLLGFEGPFPGRRHAFMQYRDYPLHIPSYDEYSVIMLAELLREVGGLVGHRVSAADWANLRAGRLPPWISP